MSTALEPVRMPALAMPLAAPTAASPAWMASLATLRGLMKGCGAATAAWRQNKNKTDGGA